MTRDRTYLRSEFCGKVFDVVDTGGLVFDDDESLLYLDQIRQQAAIALTEAVACVLVVDGQSGVTPMDEAVAKFLRKEWASKIKVGLAVVVVALGGGLFVCCWECRLKLSRGAADADVATPIALPSFNLCNAFYLK